MIITAKFESTCPHCGEKLSVGQEVSWVKGENSSKTARGKHKIR